MSLNPLICYSLRSRTDWDSLAHSLPQNNIRWKEARLDTHDVALPLPKVSGEPQRVLRAVLLSPSDVGTDSCRDRIQRLFHLNGGQDIVIVFLLKPENGQGSPMARLMMLQLDLAGESEMPVIPVNSVQSVATNLIAFHRQICAVNNTPRIASPVQTLLPYCSDRPPLPEHAVNVLADITSGIGDLLDTVSTPAGQIKIVDFLGSDSESVVSFWAKEYLVE